MNCVAAADEKKQTRAPTHRECTTKDQMHQPTKIVRSMDNNKKRREEHGDDGGGGGEGWRQKVH